MSQILKTREVKVRMLAKDVEQRYGEITVPTAFIDNHIVKIGDFLLPIAPKKGVLMYVKKELLNDLLENGLDLNHLANTNKRYLTPYSMFWRVRMLIAMRTLAPGPMSVHAVHVALNENIGIETVRKRLEILLEERSDMRKVAYAVKAEKGIASGYFLEEALW